jgi:hypothetical protein
MTNLPDFVQKQYGKQTSYLPEDMYRMNQYGGGASAVCSNQYDMPRSTQVPIVMGDIDSRYMKLRGGGCEGRSTDGKAGIRGYGPNSSFIDVSGDMYKSMPPGNSKCAPKTEKFGSGACGCCGKSTKEGFSMCDNKLTFTSTEFILFFLFIVLVFVSLYCVKSVQDIKMFVFREKTDKPNM